MTRDAFESILAGMTNHSQTTSPSGRRCRSAAASSGHQLLSIPASNSRLSHVHSSVVMLDTADPSLPGQLALGQTYQRDPQELRPRPDDAVWVSGSAIDCRRKQPKRASALRISPLVDWVRVDWVPCRIGHAHLKGVVPIGNCDARSSSLSPVSPLGVTPVVTLVVLIFPCCHHCHHCHHQIY